MPSQGKSQPRRASPTPPSITNNTTAVASPSRSTRKRTRVSESNRDQDVSTSTATEQELPQRTLKRSRTAQSVAQPQLQPDDHPASSASSSTLAASQETPLAATTEDTTESIEMQELKEEEPTIDEETLSAEQRRAIKGKGKATTPAPPSPTKPTAAEMTRMEKELASKNSLITSQLSLLQNLRNTLVCNVCLEVLEMPYALACGHVFCRPCLYSWFHRPDPNAEADALPQEDEAEELGSEEEEEIEGTSIIADDDDEEEEEEEEDNDNDSGSYIGGSFFGNRFTVRGGDDDENWEQGMGAFEAIVNAVGSRMSSRGRGRGVGGASGGVITDGGAESSGSGSGRATAPRGAALEAMRAARVARLGGGGAAVGASGSGSGAAQASTSAQIVELSSDSEDEPPVASSSHARPAPTTTNNTNTSNRLPPSPRARSPRANPAPPRAPSPPPPPPPPAPAPIGAHRHKNLICPQCRTSVHLTSPSKIFLLSDSISLIRQAERDGLLSALGGSAVPSHHGEEEKKERGPERDESDVSWGGLWVQETRREREARLARVMRDREDGVRRCGSCNWELDEETGVCNGW
ncbi:hypothetical protein BCR35DRAFT_33439 [Leucosporidium creatinivorum]|uniref:RING-type domain-containing protein n=1 Tax=Leucosporidium creatinivorum TaxID=106004 RepID=A0A1Y2CGY9_9BASI|nr:hypothetical protein BCR35DRAFT_33439 [Leucosporidium creatinivorum]